MPINFFITCHPTLTLKQNGNNGHNRTPSDTHLRSDGVPHGAGVPGADHQRASDGQVHGRVQPLLEGVLVQLLLYAVWASVSEVSDLDIDFLLSKF